MVIRYFSLTFISFKTFKIIASPINLESSLQLSCFAISCYLMEWSAKDVLISLKPLVFERRMDLVLSSPK